MSQTVFAGGGVGSGGSGGGGSSGGPWGWTTYGHGWAQYSTNGSGPSAGFHTGDWATVQSTCQSQNASTVIMYIIGTGPKPPGKASGNYMGYSYTGFSGPWGDGGSVDNGRASKLSVATAQWAFNNLGSYGVSTAGYTFGSNVGWFCWNFNPDQPPQFAYGMDCSVVRGWAYDRDNMSTKLQVHVYVGGPAGTPGAVATAVTANIDDGDPTPNVAGHVFKVDLTQEPFKSKVANQAQPVYVYTWSYNSAGTLIAGPYEQHVSAYGQTTVGPCNKPTCVPGSSGLPAAMTVGQAYYLKPQVMLSTPWGAPMTTTNPKMHYSIRYSNNGGTSWTVVPGYDNDTLYDAGFPIAGTLITANPTGVQGDRGIKFTPTSPGRYAIAWSFFGSGAFQGFDSGVCGSVGSTTNVPDQGTAGTQPYFQIIGGDIIAGGIVNGFNQNGININGDADPSAYAGAGSSLAAIVGGTASNFATGTALNTGASTKSGAGLGFANVSLGSNETAKGFIPLPTPPTVDLSGTHTNWAGVANLSTCTTKCVYDVAAGTTISGTVSPGADITLYVASGDVYLGNITYTYTSLDNIPRLNVYAASGNIIVLKDTTEIHGVFIAAGSGTKGRFYSCGIGAAAVTYQSPATDIGQCSNPLTIYGAAVANKFVLTRTAGNYVQASGAAEKFVFGPEIWLHRNTNTANGGSAAPIFDQYFSLPPVL